MANQDIGDWVGQGTVTDRTRERLGQSDNGIVMRRRRFFEELEAMQADPAHEPKGLIRDTGGCQLFVMHSDYRPLDGRYTCYGKVVDGMETVDRIRVGDKTLKVGMVVR